MDALDWMMLGTLATLATLPAIVAGMLARELLELLAELCSMLPVRTFRRGGLRFIRVGRLGASFYVSRPLPSARELRARDEFGRELERLAAAGR